MTVDVPRLRFEKTATNVTSGQNPATQATPGDTLRYRIRIENLAANPVPDLDLRDELGRLNNAAVYVPGTLNLVTVPAGADASNTNASGGTNNSGLVDIRNLSLGGTGSFIVVEYDVRVAPVLPNQSYVQNQAQAYISGIEVARSDDPAVNAAPDPLVLGDEDPTRVQITSAPRFRVLKTSTYLGASTTVLRAGDRLRYTITVKNIGTDNATGVSIRDQVPVNTTYVAGSTTINGTQLNDNAQSMTPLVDGIPVYAPEDTTPGAMRADATNTPSNVATLTFDVTVYPDLVDGTIISNQAFVNAVDFGIVDYPSDDPRTPIVNDPTRDVVGNAPLLFATKAAALLNDLSSPGIVDPGDTLRYTITIYNNGAIPATSVLLQDNVPPNTTYVADSVTLNGLPVGQPDNGTSPLGTGIYVSSTDLTPPLPTTLEQGTLSPNSSAVVTFDLRVNAGTPPGTIIRNQANVRTAEVPNLLTDGDGNPSTGPEPTVVVVGNAQQLTIAKEVSVVGGGAAVQGATLEYVVRVTNSSLVPALYVVITDDLNMPVPGYLTLVPDSATLNGQTTGITVANQLITADYFTTYGPLQPQGVVTLRFRAVINPDLLDGTRIVNTGTVTWDNPPRTASASVAIDVGAIPGQGILNGKAWHDANFSRTLEANERILEGWTVQLYRNDRLLRSATTDANGVYRISGIPPNYISGEQYELRFSAPDATASTAKLGMAYSQFTNELQRIRDIIVQFASNLQDLNLPISPNGVAYNSVSRAPAAGVTLRMLSAGTRTTLPAACFDDPAQQNQVTLVGRLLPVRHELFGPGVPERREFPDRREPAADRLHRHVLSDHPADLGPVDRRVLGTRVPRWHRRCALGDAGLLRNPDLRVRADPGCARTQSRHALPRAPEARRQPDPGLEPDLQQPHPGGSGSAGRDPDLEDDPAAERRARSARAVRHHIQERDGCADVRREHRGSHPGGLPLRRRARHASIASRSSRPWPAASSSGAIWRWIARKSTKCSCCSPWARVSAKASS